MKKIILAVLCLYAYSINAQDTATFIIPRKNDIASGIKRILWFGGVNIGRGKPDLLVGHPNHLTRGDRALMRFPLSRLIAAGEVKKAVLSFELSEPFGKKMPRIIEIEHLTEDRPYLDLLDLFRDAAEPLTSFSVDKQMPAPIKLSFDITDFVNSDLGKGFSAITLRLKDPQAEKDGNPDNLPSGIAIRCETIKLEIVIEREN